MTFPDLPPAAEWASRSQTKELAILGVSLPIFRCFLGWHGSCWRRLVRVDAVRLEGRSTADLRTVVYGVRTRSDRSARTAQRRSTRSVQRLTRGTLGRAATRCRRPDGAHRERALDPSASARFARGPREKRSQLARFLAQRERGSLCSCCQVDWGRNGSGRAGSGKPQGMRRDTQCGTRRGRHGVPGPRRPFVKLYTK